MYTIHANFQLSQDLCRTIIDLGHPSVPTGLVSMVLSATWWALYRSCLRSTLLWKRGCFRTGSSGPNCGETTLSTAVEQSEKIKGLNIDLQYQGVKGESQQGKGKKEKQTQKRPSTQHSDSVGQMKRTGYQSPKDTVCNSYTNTF